MTPSVCKIFFYPVNHVIAVISSLSVHWSVGTYVSFVTFLLFGLLWSYGRGPLIDIVINVGIEFGVAVFDEWDQVTLLAGAS